jgi:zinc/manganese transport system substrate-binding protein
MFSTTLRAAARVAAAATLVAGLVGCASGSSPGPSSAQKTLQIVAGENFWGSIVAQLAGTAGHVTSVVTDPNADPHEYETSSDDARAFATADYVVVNGAGYDTWADKLLAGNPSSKRRLLRVADFLGKGVDDNPHFWYDPSYVYRVIEQVTSDLKSLEPAQSAYFDTQHAALVAAMQPYSLRLSVMRTQSAGTPVAATESIFVYLARYLGLNLLSPPAFMQAVAEGNDPAAADVAEFQTQITSKQVKLLVYNQQTSTAVTTNLKQLAAAAGIPIVGITETIEPPNATFEQWFNAELQQLQMALLGIRGP